MLEWIGQNSDVLLIVGMTVLAIVAGWNFLERRSIKEDLTDYAEMYRIRNEEIDGLRQTRDKLQIDIGLADELAVFYQNENHQNWNRYIAAIDERDKLQHELDLLKAKPPKKSKKIKKLKIR